MKFRKTTKEQKNPASYSTGGWSMPKVSGAGPKLNGQRTAKAFLVGGGVLLLGFAGGWAGGRAQSEVQPSSLSSEAKQQYISNESELISEIAEETGSSVVSIDVQSEVEVPSFFGGSGVRSQSSAGSGFIVSEDGVIVTNRHVVPTGVTNVSITLSDGTQLDDVSVLGRSASTSSLDVAFLKINDLKGKNLTVAKLGDSSRVQVGDKVVAIGNALGQFQNTVTSGIISGYGRDVVAGDATGADQQNLTDLFQTDAAINQGNSGGPLVNINGEVIGINTAVAGGAQNIGFAIPINDVKNLISGVLETGELQQPYLGVRYISLTDDIAYQLNLETKRGAYLSPGEQSPVLSGSPASKAGLQEKDIIVKVNGIEVNESTGLANALSRFRVGDEVTLTVVRGGEALEIKTTLEAAPAE